MFGPFLSFFLSIISLTAFGQGFQIFSEKHQEGLVDSLGQVTIDAQYQKLGWTNSDYHGESLLGFRKNDKWGLMNSEGKIRAKAIYYSIDPLNESFYKVSTKFGLTNNLRHGLINPKGKQVLSNSYFSIQSTGEVLVVSEYTNDRVVYGVLDAELEMLVPTKFRQIRHYRNTLLLLDFSGNWQALKITGEKISPEVFDHIEFLGEYILTRHKGGVGLLSAVDAREIFPPKMKKIDLSTGQPTASENTAWEIRDPALEIQLTIKSDSLKSLKDGLLVSYFNGSPRVYGERKELLPDNNFDIKQTGKGCIIMENYSNNCWEARKFSGDLLLKGDSIYFDGSYFIVRMADKYDIYNHFGRKINQYPLEQVMASQAQQTPTKRGGQWGVIDFQGQNAVKFAFDSIGVGMNNVFPVKYVGEWGLIDAFGQWLVHPQYDSFSKISDLFVGERKGLKTLFSKRGRNLLVTRHRLQEGNESVEVLFEGNKKGLITSEGVQVFAPFYDEVFHFGEYYCAKRPEGSVIKDHLGRFVTPLDQGVQQVLDYHEDFFLIKKDNLFGFLDSDGRLRIANRYDSARSFSDGMAAIKLIGKWGFIDKEERLIIQPHYAEVSDFELDVAIIKENAYGLINKQGRIILEQVYQNINRTPKGSYLLKSQNGKVGLADDHGEIVLSPSFDNLEEIGNGLLVATRNKRKALYNQQGKLLLGFVYSDIKSLGTLIALQPVN